MALIPPSFLDAVVAIGLRDDDGSPRWVASGFTYGRFTGTGEDGDKTYRVYLVSNRHVFEALPDKAILRFNPQGQEPPKDFDMSVNDQAGEAVWTGHPDAEVDVAVTGINYKLSQESAMQVSLFLDDSHCLRTSDMAAKGMSEGDLAYVMGFPLGLVGSTRMAVIVRSAVVARLRDVVAGAEKRFLVDASVFPGNSGGPVVTKPEVLSIQGTQAIQSSNLIGVVSGYIPYQDVAVSSQTQRPRISFEENSGLAAVFPVDAIDEAIAAFEAKFTPVQLGQQEEEIHAD